MKVVFFILNFLCISLSVTAQQQASIFKNIVAAYRDTPYLTYKVNFHYYKNLNAKHPTDSLMMTFIQKGNHYYLNTGEIELLNDGELYLTIDNQQREIILQSINTQPSPLNLEQFLMLAAQEGIKVELFNLDKDRKGLRFTAPDYSETIAEMIYNRNTYLLDSTELSISVPNDLYESENNYTRLKATYSAYDFSKRELPISTSQVVKKSGNSYVAIGKYKGFRVQ